MGRTSDEEILKLAEKTYKTGINPVECRTYVKDDDEKVIGCCVLGAACLAKTSNPIYIFSDIFNRSDAFTSGVIAGFDNVLCDENKYSGSRKTAYIRGVKLGAKARKKFLK